MTLNNYFRNIIKNYTNNDGGHNEEHILNVYKNAKYICSKIGYDNLKLIKVIVYAHDLFTYQDRKNHHILAAKYIKNSSILPKFFNKNEINIMAKAVEEHRSDLNQTTLESKILYDADKLDCYHSIGRMIERSIYFNINNIANSITLYNDVYTHLKQKYLKNVRLHFDESYEFSDKKNIENILKNESIFKKYFEIEKEKIIKRVECA